MKLGSINIVRKNSHSLFFARISRCATVARLHKIWHRVLPCHDTNMVTMPSFSLYWGQFTLRLKFYPYIHNFLDLGTNFPTCHRLHTIKRQFATFTPGKECGKVFLSGDVPRGFSPLFSLFRTSFWQNFN